MCAKQVKLRLNNDQPCVQQELVKLHLRLGRNQGSLGGLVGLGGSTESQVS